MSLENVLYKNLAAEMARKGITIKQIALTMNLCYVSTSKKLRGITPITVPEAYEIRDKLFPVLTIDYLFDTRPRYDNIDVFNFPSTNKEEENRNDIGINPDDCA